MRGKPYRRYLTTTQAAKLANISPSTLLRSIQAKQLKAFSTPGGHFRVDPASLQTFLKGLGAAPVLEKKAVVIPLSPGEQEKLLRELREDDGIRVTEEDSLTEAAEKGALPAGTIVIFSAKGKTRKEAASPLSALRRLLERSS